MKMSLKNGKEKNITFWNLKIILNLWKLYLKLLYHNLTATKVSIFNFIYPFTLYKYLNYINDFFTITFKIISQKKKN